MYTLKLSYPGPNADVFLQYKTKESAEQAYGHAQTALLDDTVVQITDEFGRDVLFSSNELRYVALVDVRQDATGNCDIQLVQAEIRASAERRAQANPLLRSLGNSYNG